MPAPEARSPSPSDALVGGGEMGELIRSMDWSRHPLGPLETWPASLRTAVRVLLHSRYPMFIWWGPERFNLYNDAYVPVLGARHPSALGRPAAEIWRDIWDTVGPQSDAAMREGQATYNEDLLLLMERHGYPEETYFSFSYSPVYEDDGGIGGMFCACVENTQRVIAQRRLDTLRRLAASTADLRSRGEVWERSAQALQTNPHCLPFVLIFADGTPARPALAAAVGAEAPGATERGPWPLQEALAGRDIAVVDAPPGLALPAGAWHRPPARVALVPVAESGGDASTVLVVGLNPFRPFDDDYRNFLTLVAGQISSGLASAHAFEVERRRAESLAELDRAKTAFFSNVSHEFRTPITLTLGSLEDALGTAGELPAQLREDLLVAHRNSLRLLKLVNSLLDFARIEAGRATACYEPTDLAALTAELASGFRSACEKAGLALNLDCPPLGEHVQVDREMWEKIVLNLVSNAFKFTFAGGIDVSLAESGDRVELRVRDTGVGVPPEELPRLFERFHRVEGAGGRTHEGTGIGLALVQELVKLHGGSVAVESEPGGGTTFTVSIPRSPAHPAPERVGAPRPAASTATGPAPYVEEALGWLPEPAAPRAEPRSRAAPPLGRVLVADDNADMRAYLRRLLAPRFEVVTVRDGQAALESARSDPPDLVLADVMMPVLDGVALLRELRADRRTRSVPILLVSARAGETQFEGLDAGADDYLVKPFHARELLARVETHVRMGRLRKESELSFRALADAAPAMLWITDEEGRCTFLSRGWFEFTGRSEAQDLGDAWNEPVHPDDREEADRRFAAATGRREPFFLDYRLRDKGGAYRWVLDAGRPRFDATGRWLGYIGSVIDVHERREAEQALRESRAQLRSISDHVPVMISYVDHDGRFRFANAQYEEWFGVSPREVIGRTVREVLGEGADEQCRAYVDRVLAGEAVRFEASLTHRRLGRRDAEFAYVPDHGSDGEVRGFYARGVDVTDRKRREAVLRRQSERLRLLWETAGIILTSDDPHTMLQRLFSRIQGHLGIDTYFNFIVDESGRALRMASYTGVRPEEAETFRRVSFGEAICGAVAAERRPIVATHVQQSDDPQVQLVKSYGIRAYACNPLIAGGRLLGTLSFGSRTRDEFEPDEIEFLETITHYVTAAYQEMRLIGELREVDRKKDEFLATLAHELRNPLAPIHSGLQVLRTAEEGSADFENSLAIMERQTAQLTRLIDDLLDVSRISRGQLHLRKSRVALGDVVRSALEATRSFVEGKGQALEVSLPDEAVVLVADGARLAQVLCNLLSNASRYTPEAGRIRLDARREGDEVVVSVEDDGIGIAGEMLERIFDMFLRIDRSANRSNPGLGIGLTLVRTLVEMHGGTVEAQSAGPGQGSRFLVRLPGVVEGSAADTSEPASTRRDGAQARRVLIVDDNEDAAKLLGLTIRILGHQVRTAHSGHVALELAGDFRPEVVLMDLGMPGMDGYEAAQRIRSEPWGGEMTLVALTGWGQEADKRRTRAAGFDHHLVKPAEPEALQAILRGES